MAKKSITLNGFKGGLNLRSEPTDLISEGKGKDEVALAEDIYTDHPGKLTRKKPIVAAGSSPVDSENVLTSNKAIVYDSKLYVNQGVYKLGEDVNWSGNANYLSYAPDEGTLYTAEEEASTNAIRGANIHVNQGRKESLIIYLGSRATYSDSGSGTLVMPPFDSATQESDLSTSSILTNNYMAYTGFLIAKDASNNHNHWFNHWNLNLNTGFMGYQKYSIPQGEATVGNPGKLSDYQDGVWGNGQAGGSAEWYTPYKIVGPYDGLISDTSPVSADDQIDFIQKGDYNDQMAMLSFNTGNTLYDSGDVRNGGFGPVMPNPTTRDLLIEVKLSESAGGTVYAYDDSTLGTGGSTGDFRTRTVGILVTLISTDDNAGNRNSKIDESSHWTKGNADERKYLIDWSDLAASDPTYKRCRIRKAEADYTFSGASFNKGQITRVMIGMAPIYGGGGYSSGVNNVDYGVGRTLFTLYELAWDSLTTSAWASHENYVFSQSRIQNGIESALTNYNDSLKVTTSTLGVTVYKPTIPEVYEGNIYYAPGDATGAPIGEWLHLLRFHNTQGARKSGNLAWVPWSDNKVSFEFITPPTSSNYALESGYPDDTIEINAEWKTAAVVGRQVYIGNVNHSVSSISKHISANGDIVSKSATYVTGTPAGSDETAVANFIRGYHDLTVKNTDINISLTAAEESGEARLKVIGSGSDLAAWHSDTLISANLLINKCTRPAIRGLGDAVGADAIAFMEALPRYTSSSIPWYFAPFRTSSGANTDYHRDVSGPTYLRFKYTDTAQNLVDSNFFTAVNGATAVTLDSTTGTVEADAYISCNGTYNAGVYLTLELTPYQFYVLKFKVANDTEEGHSHQHSDAAGVYLSTSATPNADVNNTDPNVVGGAGNDVPGQKRWDPADSGDTYTATPYYVPYTSGDTTTVYLHIQPDIKHNNVANTCLIKELHVYEYAPSTTDSASTDLTVPSNRYCVHLDASGMPGGVVPNATYGVAGNYSTFDFYAGFENDLISKGSLTGPAGFSNLAYLDLELGGEVLNVLESAGDRLFAFTSNRLSVINVAQDIEFMEGQYEHLGVKHHRQVCRVGEGLGFITGRGVFFFDGQMLNNISDEKIINIISDYYHEDRTAMGYDAKRNILWLWYSTDGGTTYDVLYYSFIDKQWIGTATGVNNFPSTNIVAGSNGLSYFITAGTTQKMIGTSSTAGTGTFNLKTGKISCGDLNRRKRFYGIAFNSVNCSSDVNVKFIFSTFTSSPVTLNSDSHQSYDFNSIPVAQRTSNWIQVEFSGTSSAGNNLEISDISLVYRELGVRTP